MKLFRLDIETETIFQLVQKEETMEPITNPSSYYIEDTLLLEFLITRYDEILKQDQQRIGEVWTGLGLVALHQNKELLTAYKHLISSDSYMVKEILITSIDLFLSELHRLRSVEPSEYVEKEIQRTPLNRRAATKFRLWSWREGRNMTIEQECLKYYPIWELVSWLGLGQYEQLTDFETNVMFSDLPLLERLERGVDIVIESFKRRPTLEKN
jgi:hypothetical protein